MIETPQLETELATDERWQLIERITATPPFQKSARLRELLRYMAERSIHGHSVDLTEHHIGNVVFGKPADYSPVEDSSVRVQVRQLRLKLHEYFDGEGRNDPLIVEIPKGGYTTVFRTIRNPELNFAPPPVHALPEEPVQTRNRFRSSVFLPWTLAIIASALCLLMWYRSAAKLHSDPAPPWPLSEVFSPGKQTYVIVSDTNYGMLRIVGEKNGSLEQYLSAAYPSEFIPKELTSREQHLMNYISGSLLTSYADLVVVHTLDDLIGSLHEQMSIRSARDLRLRDLRSGNYILVGSPGSNPWVSLFENRLNFIEREGVVGDSSKYFENKHPLPGELATYQGLQVPGSAGVDYATIALLPTESDQGNVLLIQGLQQESTEAAALFLGDPHHREQLAHALGIQSKSNGPVYFEALIRTEAVADAPDSSTILATRIIHNQ